MSELVSTCPPVSWVLSAEVFPIVFFACLLVSLAPLVAALDVFEVVFHLSTLNGQMLFNSHLFLLVLLCPNEFPSCRLLVFPLDSLSPSLSSLFADQKVA